MSDEFDESEDPSVILPGGFSFEETPESRRSTSDPPTFTLIYKAVGQVNSFIVQQYATSATPIIVVRPTGVLYRQDLQLEPDGHAQYLVTVPYGELNAQSTPVGNFSFSFDTTGATVNIKCAKQHVATYPIDGDWHKGAIGVKSDGEVEGADIIIPALKLTYTFKHPLGIVTEAYARTLGAVTGMTNAQPFRGFDVGELLFAGAAGSDGTDAEADCAYQFIASGNVLAPPQGSGLSIGGIQNIAKRGHDYAWVEFEDEVHAGEAVKRAKRVHVDLVYDSFNFADVFGWS